MAVPLRSGAFPDVLDARFARIFDQQYRELPDRLGDFYAMKGNEGPQNQDVRYSELGEFSDVEEFTGTLAYDDLAQGYDVTFTHVPYGKGMQIERTLFDDAQDNQMDAQPKKMALAYQRTRQKHGATAFNGAFSNDTTWSSHSESVALCSDSHTTTSGASVAAGFDNLTTAALSAVAVEAARIQMRGFRGDRAQRITVVPSGLVVPPDLAPTAFEITQSQGKPDVATNNANSSYNQYRIYDWEYLTDTNNWFMVDAGMMKNDATGLVWHDRQPLEFAMVEDFDTLIGKWRIYARYSLGRIGWRWCLGAQVS